MEWESYDIVEGKDKHRYEFYSEGPNGRIKKAVKFQPACKLGLNAYNLLFGDCEEDTDRINDSVVSNNGDHKTILKTVAGIVEQFVNLHPLECRPTSGLHSKKELTMKNFLFLKRFYRSGRNKKRVRMPESGLFKSGETYPVYITPDPTDETDPYYVKKLEEAYRVFEKAPLPEFLRKQAQGLE